MTKEFIPYEQALALKELGFDEDYLGAYYHADKLLSVCDCKVHHARGEYTVLAPLHQQAFKWFREKYNLPCWVYTSNSKEFWYSVLKDGRMIVRDYKPFNTYEEAELACLKKLIEIVKQNL